VAEGVERVFFSGSGGFPVGSKSSVGTSSKEREDPDSFGGSGGQCNVGLVSVSLDDSTSGGKKASEGGENKADKAPPGLPLACRWVLAGRVLVTLAQPSSGEGDLPQCDLFLGTGGGRYF